MTELSDRLTAAVADRYTIVREIGRGGMATVYLARNLKHHGDVAIKLLRPELSGTLSSEKFLSEIRLVMRLQHPNVVSILDAAKAAGFLYFTMPHIDGKSLRVRLEKEGELTPQQAVNLLIEVAAALTAAHALGIVHRDLKPGNVLLKGDRVVVTDFGVARAVDEATGAKRLSSVGVAVASPTYMAPEQASAEVSIDHRADIYALGVVAYELLAGRPPFAGPSARVMVAHMSQAPQQLSQIRPGIKPALEAIVMRCLAKKPADRYQSVAEVSKALAPFA